MRTTDLFADSGSSRSYRFDNICGVIPRAWAVLSAAHHSRCLLWTAVLWRLDGKERRCGAHGGGGVDRTMNILYMCHSLRVVTATRLLTFSGALFSFFFPVLFSGSLLYYSAVSWFLFSSVSLSSFYSQVLLNAVSPVLVLLYSTTGIKTFERRGAFDRQSAPPYQLCGSSHPFPVLLQLWTVSSGGLAALFSAPCSPAPALASPVTSFRWTRTLFVDAFAFMLWLAA